ncbi:hypothetical protein BD310DRAFT_914745 [Dichomitus squalens]|uniref:Uncharacterized protein n=1 Tax=Dichomitus squalens TaxID=114155 RepID=A0A4V2K9M8_9APHY|nr:hypothetical protein BD310DRAFT_914745 [Dichomitus squalens]
MQQLGPRTGSGRMCAAQRMCPTSRLERACPHKPQDRRNNEGRWRRRKAVKRTITIVAVGLHLWRCGRLRR